MPRVVGVVWWWGWFDSALPRQSNFKIEEVGAQAQRILLLPKRRVFVSRKNLRPTSCSCLCSQMLK